MIEGPVHVYLHLRKGCLYKSRCNMYYLGIDIGAITGKALLISEEGDILKGIVIPTGYNREEAAFNLVEQIEHETGVLRDDIRAACSTGYGRKAVPFARFSVTEITCHARGAKYLENGADTVIDIGGQDSKGIHLGRDGRVLDFVMNDKCAAGTGRFLEVMAHALEADLEDFGALHDRADRAAEISSTCTIFAESEVITLASRGVKKEDIIAGIHGSIAKRIAAMVAPLPAGECYVMTGGVSRNRGVVKSLEQELGVSIIVPSLAQLAGALGTALIAREKVCL